ncbi:MAG: hypothetical protein KJ626_06295, partial [Verrucomicrobia bacterium]|nr:hypothetical protein [Verrucomicrobiota bacterium]
MRISKVAALCCVVLASFPVFSQAWTGDQIDFPGDVQTWVLTLNSAKYTGPDGSTEWFRYTFTAGSTDSDYNFKMVTGDNWSQDYGGNTTFAKNELGIMYYDPIGDAASILTGGVTSGKRYTFTVKNPGLVDSYISVMELSADAVSISSVSGGVGSYQVN